MSGGWMKVLITDAILIVLCALFYFYPKLLPIPNLDIISMVITLVALALTIIAFGVTRLNRIADQSAS
jgi:hypothetical protein